MNLDFSYGSRSHAELPSDSVFQGVKCSALVWGKLLVKNANELRTIFVIIFTDLLLSHCGGEKSSPEAKKAHFWQTNLFKSGKSVAVSGTLRYVFFIQLSSCFLNNGRVLSAQSSASFPLVLCSSGQMFSRLFFSSPFYFFFKEPEKVIVKKHGILLPGQPAFPFSVIKTD